MEQTAGSRVYLLRPQYEEYYSAEMGLQLPQGEEFDGYMVRIAR